MENKKINNPVLSILIVNWNTSQMTVECIKSILADKGLKETPFEIIIVDNHSEDDSVAAFKKINGPIKIIENKANLGFGAANNQALEISQGNYILLLNTDTIVLHSAISQSLDWLSSHPESYGCTAQLLNKDLTIQPSGGYFPNIFNISSLLLHLDDLPFVNKLIHPFHPHSPDFYTHDNFYKNDHPQDWVTGAYMLIRREMITKVGGFDPEYFMYGEEMEMCYRIHLIYPKMQLWYLVGPQIIHLGGASTKNKQTIYQREYQGFVTFFKKHQPKYLPIINFLIETNKILQNCINFLLRKSV